LKRDMDLIRSLLLRAETAETGSAPNGAFENYNDATVGYHNYLLVDAGLAKGTDVATRGSSGPNWLLTHLTSAGHDFLDAAREPTRWNKAKEILGTATIGAYRVLLEKLAVQYAMKAAGIDE